MRLWFSSSSEVPIYRQLVTQVVLAILCEDLRPGDRLPSTRELARRFGLHPNTISAGYRQLEQVTAILCDAYTATVPALPSKPHTLIFPFLADSTIAELGRYSQSPAAL